MMIRLKSMHNDGIVFLLMPPCPAYRGLDGDGRARSGQLNSHHSNALVPYSRGFHNCRLFPYSPILRNRRKMVETSRNKPFLAICTPI